MDLPKYYSLAAAPPAYMSDTAVNSRLRSFSSIRGEYKCRSSRCSGLAPTVASNRIHNISMIRELISACGKRFDARYLMVMSRLLR